MQAQTLSNLRGEIEFRRKLAELLICPDCLQQTQTEATLQIIAGGLRCPSCSANFPQVEGVQLLLPTDLFRALYPELAASS